jgi:hypothetical protein
MGCSQPNASRDNYAARTWCNTRVSSQPSRSTMANSGGRCNDRLNSPIPLRDDQDRVVSRRRSPAWLPPVRLRSPTLSAGTGSRLALGHLSAVCGSHTDGHLRTVGGETVGSDESWAPRFRRCVFLRSVFRSARRGQGSCAALGRTDSEMRSSPVLLRCARSIDWPQKVPVITSTAPIVAMAVR